MISLRNSLIFFLTSLLFLLPSIVFSQNDPFNSRARSPLIQSSVMPAEQAFALNTFVEASGHVVLLWEIADGYYLYRDSIAIHGAQEEEISLGELPQSSTITDEFFGESQAYFDRLQHRVPLENLPANNNSIHFTLQYQGCAKDKYCYPMQRQEISLSVPEGLLGN